MNPASDEPISVLLISSDEDDARQIGRIIDEIDRPHFVLERCRTLEEAKANIDKHSHDIYLISDQFASHSGLELLKLADPEKHYEPFILLAGAFDQETEQRAIRLGASDYLVKDILNAELLTRSFNYSLGRRQAEAQRLQHLIELNQAKDEFISVASHQLRTPATGVKQYIGMILAGIAGEVPDEQRVILQKAYDSNERQLKIVTDLLNVARIDAGKVILNQSRLDINQLVAEIVKEQAEIAKGKQQIIRFTPSKAAVEAWIDADTIRMVLDNLIDNARKYSREGSMIEVAVADRHDAVIVEVIDEGVGIADEDKGKLFEKFSQIHNDLSDQTEGSGLGLYWVKKITDLHGGEIEVVSEPGHGSTFSVSLPKSL